MSLWGYRLNLDALLARLVYRYRWRALLTLAALVAGIGLGSGAIPPAWRGAASLDITAAPGATLSVDGRPWPRQLYAGRHTVAATLPDGRAVEAALELRSGAPLSLTLPAGLLVEQRELLPAAPDMAIERVWWADGGWRVRSVATGPSATPTPTSSEESAPLNAPRTVAYRGTATELLSTIDAYGGLADQLHRSGGRLEARYRPGERLRPGELSIDGWGDLTTVPLSAELALLQFAPDGAALLLGEHIPGGVQLLLARSDGGRERLVALPGEVLRVEWRADSRAAAVISAHDGQLALTLLRLTPPVAGVMVAVLPSSGDLLPLAWDDSALLWVAPDDAGRSTLWRAELGALLAEQIRPLDALALMALPDGALRIVRAEGGSLVIGQQRDDLLIVEARLAIQSADAGLFHGDQLLLWDAGRAWLITLKEHTNG